MLALWPVYLHKISPSISAFFFSFFRSNLLTLSMDTADSASVNPSLLYERKKKNLGLWCGLQHSEYLRPAARAVGLHVKPFHSFWSRQLSWEEQKTLLQIAQRIEEETVKRGDQEGGSKWSRTVCDLRWAVHVRTRLCWLQRNPLWAEVQGWWEESPQLLRETT